jgi:hypothetical protein
VLSNTLDKKHRSLAIPIANFNTEGRNIIMGLEDYCQQNETLDCCVTVSFFLGGGGICGPYGITEKVVKTQRISLFF